MCDALDDAEGAGFAVEVVGCGCDDVDAAAVGLDGQNSSKIGSLVNDRIPGDWLQGGIVYPTHSVFKSQQGYSRKDYAAMLKR